MYRSTAKEQLELSSFYLPFGGRLDPENRWIGLSKVIPWKEFEEQYAEQFAESGMGAPAKPFRMALGALLIKEKLNLTDEETVLQLRENPYLQYLVGIETYQNKAPFDPSMMVHFRKRITEEMLREINEKIHEAYVKKNERQSQRVQKLKNQREQKKTGENC